MSKARDGLLSYLQEQIREKLNDRSDFVAAVGGCEDYADYKYNCGIIYGLALAEGMLLDLDDMQHRNDDD
jgi:hypothetical protein